MKKYLFNIIVSLSNKKVKIQPMPNPIISHQAPALLIKIKFPNRIDGTAICIGALVPDLYLFSSYIFQLEIRRLTHSLLGLFLWTVPLTILLTMLFCRYIGPIISNFAKKEIILTKPLRFFGVDNWNIFKKKVFNKQFFIVAFYSALIGGLTHLLFDLPAHQSVTLFYPWIFPVPNFLLTKVIDFGTISIGIWQYDVSYKIYNIIWHIESVILFFISLYLLRFIKKHELISSWDKNIEKFKI
jgi:membrane-bound metal-dependent hydrolase YbcI (DUF457 family)